VDSFSPKDRIYLTRSRLGKTKWKASGEEALEERLASYGFHVIAPEYLPIERQIQIFTCGTSVLGSIGSAFHTALFAASQSPKQIGILAHGHVNPRFILIDSIKRNRVTYFNTLSENSTGGGHPRDVALDVGTVLDMLDQGGWLSS
jgi:capsular polysaccharide biosynthesis protein